jgi:predicted peptidase
MFRYVLPFVIVSVILLVASSAAAQTKRIRKPAVSPATLALYEQREFKGVKYRLMKPINFDSKKTYPLILSLHGAGGRGSKNIQNLRKWNEWLADKDLRRKHPAVILAPQSTVSWNDPKSPLTKVPELSDEMIRSWPAEMRPWLKRWQSRGSGAKSGNLDKVFELIDTVLMKEFKIDADRVYCLGHSMGGAGTFTAIYLQPERFAAAIPTAGAFAPWRDVGRIKDVPIWAFHGDNDPTVPYIFTKHTFDQLKAIGGNMKFTTLKGVKHGASRPAFHYTGDDASKGFTTAYASDRPDKTDDVWDWLFSRRRLGSAEKGPKNRPASGK